VALGLAMLLAILPFFGLVMGSSVVWIVLDCGSTMRLSYGVNKLMRPLTTTFMKHEEDGFIMLVIVTAGVILPALSFYNLWYTATYGFNVYMWFAYHVYRVGPMAMHFAIVNTLAHKEGHTYTGMFKKPYNSVLRYAFNFWIGLFYGLAPSTYTYGHSRNHHAYNNEQGDVVSTGDRARDNFLNYLAYIPRWFAYHVNITTYMQFSAEANDEYAGKMVFGSAYYLTFVGMCGYVSPVYALAYLLYPLLESGVFLSAINWAWHAFNDPVDVSNEYISSITILGGPFNVLHEDYHVVHHQYPGTHWTKHPALFDKHKDDYIKHQATIFENCHAMEIFILSVTRQYKWLATKFVDLSGKLTLDDKATLLKQRLQAVTWQIDDSGAPQTVLLPPSANGPKMIWQEE